MVEDALGMNDAAPTRHELQVFREYEPDPSEIATEKHKVLQILGIEYAARNTRVMNPVRRTSK